MAYINGRKILICMIGGRMTPITLKVVKGDGEEGGGDDVEPLSTLANLGKYSLFELEGKALNTFR